MNSEQHRRTTIARSIAALDRVADADVGHVPHPDGKGVARSHDRRADPFHAQGAAGALDQVFAAAGLPEAGGGIAAGASQRFLERAQRHPVAGQPRRVGEHLELAALAADHRHLRDAGRGQQPAPDQHVRRRTELERRGGSGRRVLMWGGLQGDEHDLAHDRRVRRQHRRTDVCRQRGERRCQPFGHRLPCAVDVGAPVEIDPDDGDADRGGRAHPPHVGRTAQDRFDGEGDQRFQVARRHALRLHQHGDGRRADVRQHVDRCVVRDGSAPEKEDGRPRQHDQAVAQRPVDERVEQHGPRRSSVRMPVCGYLWREGGEPDERRAADHDALARLDGAGQLHVASFPVA